MANEAAARQCQSFILVCTAPDVCLTPMGDKKVPVPYPVVHTMDQSAQCSPNVFFNGKAAFLHQESYVDAVQGDEAGTGGGVKTGVHKEISHSHRASTTVFVNGQPLVRSADPVWMNTKKP